MSFSRESRRSKRKRSGKRIARRMVCETLEPRVVLSATIGNNIGAGDQLQNYRLAIAATAEYTAFFGGQTQALAAIESFVSSVNEIFEEELSIHFDLVSGTNTIFTNAATDGYSNGNTTAMLGENTPILNTVVGAANYDIGHVFGTSPAGGAGLAGLRVVNGLNTKGRGASISSNPQGPSWVKLVGHEFGHQFGADHTFNANAFGAAISQRSGSNAYEPASGSTIMSYAGISDDINGDDNLQQTPDDYFHSASFEQIQTFVGGAGFPNSTTATGNNIPTVSGGVDYTIPAGTAFELTAAGSDADSGDTLTYTWEQLDLGPAMSLPLTDNGSSPLFRSFPPSTDPNRVFPRLSDLAAGVNTAAIGEVLPTATRDLNFRTTVRDGNNGVHSDDVLISVVNTGTPFAITAPNGAENWSGGTSQTISWNVGGTDANGINVADVAIDLSLDGGLTYPFTLELSTPNDGSHTLNSPNIDVAAARIRVRPLGNVFFDISDANFTITANAGAAGVTVTESGGSTFVSEDGVVGGAVPDTYTLALNTSPAGTVSVTVEGGTQTEVSLDGTNFFSSVIADFTDTTPQTVHVRGLDDSLAEGIHSGTITHTVTSSADSNYPLGAPINPVIASIADDELQPVVGVDFDQASGTSPTNWTRVSETFGGTITNLIREDGVATGIGLTLAVSGAAGLNPSAPDAVPFHSPTLDAIDGNHLATESLTLTWTGLTPGRDYNVYLLTAENFGDDVLQDISITGGAGNPLPFVQDTSAIGNGLLVNRGLADPSKPIEADAVIAQADSNGEIRIVVSDISGGGVDDALLSGAAIQEIGPSTVGFSVIQSGDSTTVSEAGSTDSFDVVLFSQPTGDVVINVSSDDTDEAVVGPTTLTFDGTNWNVPQTVTVTGVDDALVDGSQTSTVTLTIDAALTTDDSFDSVGDRLVTVVTQDDEAVSLVGVDFDNSGASPNNWTRISDLFGSTTNDLTREDGSTSPLDLEVAVSGGANVQATPAPSNLPDHIPTLAGLDGLRLASGSITLTWRDLSPGTEYDLWLFTAEPFIQNAIQLVTITGGAGNPAPFTMDTSAMAVGSQLLVNSALASPSRTLQDDAVRATASATGQIQISVTNNGGDFVFLSGAAIQEVVAAPVVDRDYGDAPTAAQSGFAASYPVTLADNGARHTPTGPTLGAARDAEADGVPSAAADGDDLADGDDEDGVVFSGLGVFSTTAAVNIEMGNVAPAKVDAWIDFNRDGDWDDAGEKILDSVDVSNAMQTLNYAVPAGITAGDTYARVRLSTAGGLSPTGLAADGEVEDHLIHIGSPQVESVVINGGDPQRSGITTVQVTFDRVVNINAGGGDVFEFVNTTTSETASDFSVVTEVGGKTVVDFIFVSGPSVNDGGGLDDGDYVLTIDAALVSAEGDPLDGNGDGTPGDDYVFGASAVDNFYRKYGDFVPNGTVDLFDFAAFRSAFGKSTGQAGYEEGLDAQNDGIINLFDFAQFRANFGT